MAERGGERLGTLFSLRRAKQRCGFITQHPPVPPGPAILREQVFTRHWRLYDYTFSASDINQQLRTVHPTLQQYHSYSLLKYEKLNLKHSRFPYCAGNNSIWSFSQHTNNKLYYYKHSSRVAKVLSQLTKVRKTQSKTCMIPILCWQKFSLGFFPNIQTTSSIITNMALE